MSNGDIKSLLLELLGDDPALQTRERLDDDYIEQLAEVYRVDPDKPPAVRAVYEEKTGKYYRWDGNHRCAAARQAGRKTINCILTHGTYRDAVLLAAAANKEHDTAGRGRTRKDKRNAISRLLNDAEWCRWSDNKIAEYLVVSAPLVATVRREMQAVEGSVAQASASEPRQGKDGRTRNVPVADEPGPESEDAAPDFWNGDDENIYSADDGEPMQHESMEVSDDEPEFGDAAEPPDEIADIAREHNAAIEAFARKITGILKEAPESVWLDKERRGNVEQLLSGAAGAVRAAKVLDKPCPKCDGCGNKSLKDCKSCRGFKCMPKQQYEMAGGL